MGCGCGNTQSSQPLNTTGFAGTNSTGDCTYTKEQCANWLVICRCMSDNGYYTQIPNMTQFRINLYIGILQSVANYNGSPCIYQNELAEIEAFINVVTSMNLCQ